MPYSSVDQLPSGVKDNLPTYAQHIYMAAFNNAYDGTCKGQDACAAKIAWSAVENKYKKQGDTWVKKADLTNFELVITKATTDPVTGVHRFTAVASGIKKDAYDQYMTLDLFNNFIKRAETGEQVPEQFRSDYWSGGMPYVGVSHYSDLNGKGVVGIVDKLYVNGNCLKAKGHFLDTPLALTAWENVKKSVNFDPVDERIRLSIGFLDWKHAHGDQVFTRKTINSTCRLCKVETKGVSFLDGQLIHLALTRVPAYGETSINPELEVERSMTTQIEDAASIVGTENAEELERSKVEDSMVNKSEALIIKSEEDEKEVDVTEEVTPVVEEAKTDKKQTDHQSEYGNVEYADSKNHKYPVDTEKHIRAAWSYIHMPKNQKGYTPAEVKAIEGKIVSAWKKVIDPKGPDESVKKSVMEWFAEVDKDTVGSADLANAYGDMWLPYGGAISFDEMDQYMGMVQKQNDFYQSMNAFNDLANNIMQSDMPIDQQSQSLRNLMKQCQDRIIVKSLATFDKPKVEKSEVITTEVIVPVIHDLDEEVNKLKAVYDDVIIKTMSTNDKLMAIQEPFNEFGRKIKEIVEKKSIIPVSEASIQANMNVEVLKSTIVDAIKPLLERVTILETQLSATQSEVVASKTRQEDAVPVRRSISATPFVGVEDMSNISGKPLSVKEVVDRSVYGK